MTILVFDLETIQRPIPTEVMQGIKNGTVLADYVTKDPAKIADKVSDGYWKQFEGSQPVCVGFGLVELEASESVQTFGFQSGSELAIADYVLETINEIKPRKICGFNSRNFDFPILQYVCAKSANRLVRPFGYRDHIDLAEEIPKFFTCYRSLKGKPTSCAEVFGIKRGVEVDGSDVAALFAADCKNKTQKVLEYCLDDVRITGELLIKLSKLRSFY